MASFALGAITLFISGCFNDADPLVLYCAWDAVHSREIIRAFEKETGINVVVRYDTEATKSTGLVNRIRRERKAPQCDVFWNNETLGTITLAREGLTEAYQGPGWGRIPAQYKNPEGLWCGFAARLRVWIVNTKKMPATQQAVEKAFKNRIEDFTFAKPMFGTTLTHSSVYWSEVGGEEFKAMEKRLRTKATVANGNGKTRDLVANGTCAFGWTDTDDFYGALDAGKPVAMVPYRLPSGQTICIPNSVAIIKDTGNRKQAERLVDYLLSRKTELRLARSNARQIPLGDIGDAELPEAVQVLVGPAHESVAIRQAADVREEVLAYLLSVYDGVNL